MPLQKKGLEHNRAWEGNASGKLMLILARTARNYRRGGDYITSHGTVEFGASFCESSLVVAGSHLFVNA